MSRTSFSFHLLIIYAAFLATDAQQVRPSGLVCNFSSRGIFKISEVAIGTGCGYVILSNNLLSKVWRTNFRGFNLLERLDLSDNRINEVDYLTFERNTYLGFLDFSINDLSHLKLVINPPTPDNPIYRSEEQLRVLNVSHNVLREMPDIQPPHQLSSIHTYDLGHNLLTHIPESYFQYSELKYLFLEKNRLNEVGWLLILGETLELLNLASNSFVNIFVADFSEFKSLRVLNLNNNSIRSVPNLAGATVLTELYLLGTSIKHMRQDVFKRLYRHLKIMQIDTLDCNCNTLQTLLILRETNPVNINSGVSARICQSPERFVNTSLGDIRMTSVPFTSCDLSCDFQRLKLTYIPTHISRTCTSVFLQYNLITNLTARSFDMFNRISNVLANVHLSHNRISVIEKTTFYQMKKLRSIYLNFNELDSFELQIEDVSKSVAEGSPTLLTYDVSNNRMKEVPYLDEVTKFSLNYLNFSHNQLTSAPRSYFRGFKFLTILDLSYNKLRQLNFLNDLQWMDIERIDVSNNELADGLFKYASGMVMDDLKYLNIDNNRLTTFPNLTKFAPNIEHLLLEGNPINISSIPNRGKMPLILKNLTKMNLGYLHCECSDLKILFDLKESGIQFVTTNPFSMLCSWPQWLRQKNISNILPCQTDCVHSNHHLTFLPRFSFCQRVLFDRNKIRKLELTNFMNDITLVYIDLSDNYISQIHIDTFIMVRSLSYLNLSGNRLTRLGLKIHWQALLVTLDASRNKLTSMPFLSLSIKRKIEYLYLSRNNIKTIMENYFQYFRMIKSLDMQENKLFATTWIPYLASGRLEVLDLSSNAMNDSFSYKFRDLSHLKVVNLSYNQISPFMPDFSGLGQSITEIFFSGNKVVYLKPNNFEKLIHLTKLQVENLDCDCKTLETLITLRNRHVDVKVGVRSSHICASPPEQRIRPISQWTLDECDLTCSFQSWNLTTVPSFISKSCNVIHLDNNFITNLTSQSFYMLEHNGVLQKLYISHNFITSVGHAFANAVGLEELVLDSNLLEDFGMPFTHSRDPVLRTLSINKNMLLYMPALDVRVFSKLVNLSLNHNQISTIPNGYFNDTKLLKYLDLSKNRLSEVKETIFPKNNILFSLKMANNHFTEDSVLTFSRLTELDYLDLRNNEIYQLPDLSATRVNLRYLYITGTRISHLKVTKVELLSNLEIFEIDNLECDCDTLHALIKLRSYFITIRTGESDNSICGSPGHFINLPLVKLTTQNCIVRCCKQYSVTCFARDQAVMGIQLDRRWCNFWLGKGHFGESLQRCSNNYGFLYTYSKDQIRDKQWLLYYLAISEADYVWTGITSIRNHSVYEYPDGEVPKDANIDWISKNSTLTDQRKGHRCAFFTTNKTGSTGLQVTDCGSNTNPSFFKMQIICSSLIPMEGYCAPSVFGKIYKGRCYFKPDTEAVTYANARRTCRLYNGQLIKLEGATDASRIMHMMGMSVVQLDLTPSPIADYQTFFWIGLERIAIRDVYPPVWKWTDGSLGSFENWTPGFPASADKRDCAASAVLNLLPADHPIEQAVGTWQNFRCDQKFRYICMR